MKLAKGSTEEFITKARQAHGEKFDYSQVRYTRIYDKVSIVCPSHGPFEQVARDHLRGCGCKQCSGVFLNTTDDFIRKARIKHGERYDYSRALYTHAHAALTIICRQHGPFEQRPSNHLQGSNCPRCPRYGRRLTNEQFIERLLSVHGKAYDYSQVKYNGGAAKVIIICPAHGPFSVKPSNLLRGGGCRHCAHNKMRTSFEDFLEQASILHNSKYDYSQVNYKSTAAKISIICPKHGPFEQTPNDHLQGHGCTGCAVDARRPASATSWGTSWLHKQAGRTAQLYIVRLSGNGEEFYKVGVTYQSINERFYGQCPYTVEPVAVFCADDAQLVYKVECEIKKRFKSIRYTPRYKFGGFSECMIESQPILAFLHAQAGLAVR